MKSIVVVAVEEGNVGAMYGFMVVVGGKGNDTACCCGGTGLGNCLGTGGTVCIGDMGTGATVGGTGNTVVDGGGGKYFCTEEGEGEREAGGTATFFSIQ